GVTVRFDLTNSSGNGNGNLILMCLLAFAIVGSNEVAMTITIISLSLYYASSVLRGRGILNKRILILIVAAIGSAILVFAPGNNLRAESDLSERDAEHIWEALSLTLTDSIHFIGEFLWLPMIPLICVGMLTFSKHAGEKFNWKVFSGILVLIFVLILATTFPTYYIYKNPPPLRTQNFGYWILILGSIYLGRLLSPLLSQVSSNIQEKRINMAGIVFLILIFVFSGSNGIHNAYADLISGSAQEFKEQYKSRSQLLSECSLPTCNVPAYTAYPFTTF